MKVCVLGAGAMGSSIGGLLADGGSEVYFLDNWAEHVQAMNSQGLKLRVGSNERVVKVRAATDCRGIGPADLIIVLLKSFIQEKPWKMRVRSSGTKRSSCLSRTVSAMRKSLRKWWGRNTCWAGEHLPAVR